MRKHFKGIFLALAAVLPAVAGCDKEDKYLNVDPGSVELNSDAQYIYVDIDASASWMGYCSSEWLEAFMPGDSIAGNTSKLCLRVANANLSLYDRDTEVTIVTGDTQTFVLPVLQRAVNVLLSVSPNSLLEFSSEGVPPSYTLTVTATLPGNEDWVFETGDEWLKVVQGTGTDVDKLTVSAARSMQFEDRRDSVFVRPANEDYAARTVKVPVIQYGANLFVDAGDGFTMDADGTVEISDAAANIALSVFSNNTWTVTDNSGGRISMNMSGGGVEMENGTVLVITVPPNTSAAAYSYTLTFTCGGEIYEYKLVQAAP